MRSESDLTVARNTIVDAAMKLRDERGAPIVIALDGASGSGKSTLAGLLAETLDAALVPVDDFFASQISDAGWDARRPAARAADALDWRRLRSDALEPLRARAPARWRAFDFAAGTRDDGTYATCAEASERPPAPFIILDGAYCTRPELADLIDLRVLVDAPAPVRRRRLAQRDAPAFLAAWHARWDAAEYYYFTHVRPPASFDIVVGTAADGEAS